MSAEVFFRRAKKSKFFLLGAIGVIILLIVILLVPYLLPYDYATGELKDRNLKPEWFSNGLKGHILGCDALGRDVLARAIYGGRISMFIAVVVVAANLIIGTVMGLIAGTLGGKVDNVIMRICEIFQAVPGLMLALCIVAVIGVNFSNLIIVMLITGWSRFTRLVRGSVLSIRNMEYVKASKALGGHQPHIIFTQILPNVVTPLIILASQSIGSTILSESGLSYLGCGVPVPTPAWGSMISEGRQYLTTAPWLIIVPGVFLMFTVLSFNFLGDGLRDILDPKNKD
ncbi:MAG: ABC transporter permease [Oscillospiraceae bacterium]